MTTMDDTVCDSWTASDLGFTDLFDNGHDDTYDLDFGDSCPRVKLPSTTPLNPDMELYSTEMVDTWAQGSPLKGRSSLTRTASIEFAFGKVRGLKRDASLDKIFVSPMNMETWGEDLNPSAATDVSAAAPAPAAPAMSTASAPPIVAPPVHVVTAPPAVAPAAPVTASAAPTMPETAPTPPKNKNKRKAAQKKGRAAQAEDDAEDDAAATAQSNTKTTQSNAKTARAAGTAPRQRSSAASTKAPAASSRAPSASTRASTSTARATAADDAAPYAQRATSRAMRRAAKAQRAIQSLMDADVEDASGVDSAEATSVNAFGNANAITKDAANLTPSPTRTPPPSASTTAPALAPAGALDRVAASPQNTSRQGKESASKAQADVDEHTTANNDNEGSNVRAYVDVAEILRLAPATQSALADHPQDERAQQLPTAPMQSMPASPLAHYVPPAPAYGHPSAHVYQSADAALSAVQHATGDVRLAPVQGQNMPAVGAVYYAQSARAHYPPPAPAYYPLPTSTHQQLLALPPWYHNVVSAAQAHTMTNGQPMLPTTMSAPLPTMLAPPMQYPANASAMTSSAYQAQQASSMQHGPWVPPSYPTSIAPPAPAPYYSMGAPPSGASGLAYPTASGPSSSRVKRYTSFVDSNGMTRMTSPFPQRASGIIMPGSSSGSAAGGSTSNAGQGRMDAQSVARLLAQSKGTGIPDDVRKIVEEQFPEIVAKMREESSAWALQDTTPPPQVDAPNRDFSRGEPVLCKLEHDRGKPPCRHVFMVDRSKIDDDAYKSDYEGHVLKHLEHSAFKLWPCWWKGCNNKHPFMGTKNGIGHHVAEHIFKELRERILRERQEQILRERQEQRLKEVQDLGGQPAPKRARYH